MGITMVSWKYVVKQTLEWLILFFCIGAGATGAQYILNRAMQRDACDCIVQQGQMQCTVPPRAKTCVYSNSLRQDQVDVFIRYTGKGL